MQTRAPFHLAFPVHSIDAARGFYAGVLGCPIGRESQRWIDFDFYGHQISAHLVDQPAAGSAHNDVDGKRIPVRHFGLVLAWPEWEDLAQRLRQQQIVFVIEPGVRFAGEIGEQGTFFIADPSGNCLEFKTFRDPARMFARE